MASRDGYTIERICGCSVVRGGTSGGIPMNALAEVAKLHRKDSFMDTNLARILDASVVVGSTADLERLWKDPDVLAAGRLKEERLPSHLPAEARRWLVWGEQGTSSLAAFQALSGYRIPGRREDASAPSDLGDLRRCLLMVEAIPGYRGRVPELAALSSQWKALAEGWDALEASLEAEAPRWRDKGRWDAPETQRLFHAVLAGMGPSPRPC